MKKFLVLIVLLSSVINAQYKVKGTMNPAEDYSWVLLYKIEGARQVFLQNKKVAKEGKKGTFEFTLPADTKKGSYRITFDLEENGYVDFLFNKENIELAFNPKDTQNTLTFLESKENKLYRQFLIDLSQAQYSVDSAQVAFLKTPTTALEKAYKKGVKNIERIQSNYNKASEGMLVHSFIKATDRYNAPEAALSSQNYLRNVISHFYDKIDFSNKDLYNSSFLIDRITDYVFYMNYSDNEEEQLQLQKKAVDVTLSKVDDVSFKADVIEFLVSQFSAIKNTQMVDYIMKNHFDQLPKEKQNKEFKDKILAELSVAIGRTAPDFSWEENGRMLSVSSLNDGENYLLIFYSTECSHCLREIPQVFDFMKDKTKTKVIAFAMETTDKTWENYITKLPGWHHILGLNKWENEVARKYQINATPTYFILSKDKKIIATPNAVNDVKKAINTLN